MVSCSVRVLMIGSLDRLDVRVRCAVCAWSLRRGTMVGWCRTRVGQWGLEACVLALRGVVWDDTDGVTIWRGLAFDLDTIKLLMELFVRAPCGCAHRADAGI